MNASEKSPQNCNKSSFLLSFIDFLSKFLATKLHVFPKNRRCKLPSGTGYTNTSTTWIRPGYFKLELTELLLINQTMLTSLIDSIFF